MALNKEIEDRLKFLDLKYIRTNWDKILDEAKEKNPSFHNFLEDIITTEFIERKERQRQSRIRRANIEEPWVMETYPFIKQPNLKKKFVMELYDSMDFVKKPQDLIFIGPTGCGKTGIATSYLMHALNHGYRGYSIDFKDLLLLLYKSVADHTEKHVLKRFQTYDCLLIDEMGYASAEKEQAGMFFDLMKRRHKKKTTLITTQLGFDDWGTFLKNPHLTSALIDRLTENCTIFKMQNCSSIRPKNVTYGTTD